MRRLIENCKEVLDKGFVTGAFLMDLSKSFDCIPHDLLVVKLQAYSISLNAVTFIYSYLKRRKQTVKIHDVFSSFQTLLSGVPQDLVLGPILFNIFLNDLLPVFKKSQLYKVVDDTLFLQKQIVLMTFFKIFKKNSDSPVKWFKENNMIVNPEKIQTTILQNGKKKNTNITLNIENIAINTPKSVNKLNFEDHVSVLYKKAYLQLNAINRLQKYMGKKEKRQ